MPIQATTFMLQLLQELIFNITSHGISEDHDEANRNLRNPGCGGGQGMGSVGPF